MAAARPPRRARPPPGRKPFDDRTVLCGILFVLYTAIPWGFLAKELGYGSGMTCWLRLRDWNDAVGWRRLHEVLLSKVRAADQLDMSRAVIDGSHGRALTGGPKLGFSPADRREPGSKHHVIIAEPAHRLPPMLELAVVGFDRVVGVPSTWCHADGTNSSSTLA
ncbi:transposase [Micromonosporaceae bacterium B7E4]